MGRFNSATPTPQPTTITYTIEQMRDFDRLIREKYTVMKYSAYFDREIATFDREAYLLDKRAISVVDGTWHVIPYNFAVESERIYQWEKYRDRKLYAQAMETKELEAMAASVGDSMHV